MLKDINFIRGIYTIQQKFQAEDNTIYKSILIQGIKSVKVLHSQRIFDELDRISSKYQVAIQLCSAARIVTWEHIFFASLYAMLAFKQKRNLLKHLALEILLYISGQRQIKIAIEEFGIKEGDNCIIILGNDEKSMEQILVECEKLLGGERSDEVFDISNSSKQIEICNYFQISDEELDATAQSNTREAKKMAILKAILNRMALITLEK